MKGLLTFLVVFLLIMAMLASLTGSTNEFSFKSYLQSLNDLPHRPALPSLEAPENPNGLKEWVEAIWEYCKFFGEFVVFIFKMIIYYAQVVTKLIGGLFSWV